MMSETAKRKRPFGVTVCGLWFLLGCFPALIAVVLAGISGPPDTRFLDAVIRLMAISSPLIFLLTAVGLFMLKTWGRWMAMICSPLLAFISLGILGILWGAIFPPDVVSMIIKLGPILLSAVIIFYLFRPKVKEQFK